VRLASAALGALACLAIGARAEAQVQTTYTFRQYAQTYVPLANGTPVTINFTDGAVTVPIGFTFNFYGAPYDHLGIGINGAISFVGGCAAGCQSNEFCNGTICTIFTLGPNTLGIPNPTAPNKIVAAWWDELTRSAITPATNISYATLGNAPNRELVVEWANIRHLASTSGPDSHTSFQIRLEEGSDVIRLAYGPYTPGTDNSQWSSVIGIEDSLGTQAVVPFACSNLRVGCDFRLLESLSNQVIEFTIPIIPELTGALTSPLGGLPGDVVSFVVRADNIGRQPTGVAFQGAVYLSTDSMIVPGQDTLIGTVHFAPLGAHASETATLTVAIPNLPVAYYTAGAYIDSGDVVMEGTKTNNIVLSPQPFLLGSDLEARFQTTPPPLPPSGHDTSSFSIINHSSALPAVGWNLYLSHDGTLDASDALIAQGTSALPARTITTLTPTATVPNVPIGMYQAILVVDPANRIAEVDETNNTAVSSTFLVGPDLIPSEIVAPATSGPGMSLPMTVAIANSGSGVSGVLYRVYLSLDTIVDATDSLVASGTVTVPRAGTARITQAASIPVGLMNGTYNLILDVDPNNTIAEVDETNNVSPLASITLVGPDLAAGAIHGPLLAFRGLPYAIDASVNNTGGTTVSDFFVSFHLSTNQLITFSDPMIAQVGPLTLSPGQTQEIMTSPVIPVDFRIGPYYLGMIVNSTSVVAEGNLTNNVVHQSDPITVRDPAPDFTVSEIKLPSIAAAGEPFPVQRALENRGNAAGTFDYDVYLVDQTGMMRIAPIAHGTATLAAGAIADGVDQVLVPAETPAGVYRVQYDLNPTNATDELDTTNNVAVSYDPLTLSGSQLSLVSSSPPLAIVGVPYAFTLVARGAMGPLSFAIASGNLAPGLMLDPASGKISGTPTTEGLYRFTVHITDGTSAIDERISLLVSAPTIDLKILTRSLPPIWAKQPYDFPLTAIGGVTPYRWSISIGQLPPGLVLTSSGSIAGTTSTTTPSMLLTFRVTDAAGAFVETLLPLRVIDRSQTLHFGTDPLADGIVNNAYSETFHASGGMTPYTFALADGDLPPGLSIQGTSLEGTPTAPGVFAFRASVSDPAGDFDRSYFVVTIQTDQGVRFVTKGLPAATVGKAYVDDTMHAITIKAIDSNSTRSLHYLVVQGATPPGLSLLDDGTIAGTPTRAGVFSFVAAATDEFGQHDVRAFGIAVSAPPMTTTPKKSSGCGCTAERGEAGWPALFAIIALLILRRRRASALLAACIALSSTGTASAQDAGTGDGGTIGSIPYFTSMFSDPFVLRTTGTAVNFPTSIDDDESIQPLPFSFRFFGNDYSEVHVGTNGYVAFDQAARSLANTNIPNPALPNNLIAAFWDDLVSPDVSISIEGAAPQRVAVIQWHNAYHYTHQGDQIDFQIWLFEGPSARFEIHWGSATGAATDYSASIGFENSDGTVGVTAVPCTPTCAFADFQMLDNQAFRALQDGGNDIVAVSVDPALTTPPIHVYQGIPFTVLSVLASYHTDPIGPFSYAIDLVQSGQATLLQPPVFESSPITLMPYETRTQMDQVTLPLSTAPGRYKVALVADPEDRIMEPNKANNVVIGSKEIIVGEREPDFTVTDVSVSPTSVAPGQSVTVQATLQNAGNLDAATTYKIVLSSNLSPSVGDFGLYSSPEAIPIASGQSQMVSVPVPIPTTLYPGRYYVGVIVDPDNLVAELDEVNNTGRTASPLIVGTTMVDVTTNELPTGYVGIGYQTTLQASGGDGEFGWELVSGPLPAGLMLVSSTGQIIGTPTAPAQASITVLVSSNGASAMRTLTLGVVALDGPLTIVTRSLLPGIVGASYPPSYAGEDPSTEQHVVAVGGTLGATRTFSLISNAPAGLALDRDGFLHGTPLARGVFDVEVQVTDGTHTATRALAMTIVEPGRLSLIVGPLPNAVLDEPYSQRIDIVGQSPTGTITFGLVSGAGDLPDGLALNQTGSIDGTPSKAGTWSFVVRVVEGDPSAGVMDMGRFSLTVEAPLTLGLSPSSLPDAMVGVPYDQVVEAHNGTPPYTWSIDLAEPLPDGINEEIAESNTTKRLHIYGTPKETVAPSTSGIDTGGLTTLLVHVDDSAGRHVDAALSLHVLPAPKIVVAPKKGCGCSTSDRRSAGRSTLMLLLAGCVMLRRRRHDPSAR
jgi:MYXO-CTERM domain-containing protein